MSVVSMFEERKEIVIVPRPPYAITPHLRRFSLREQPIPCIYDEASRTCRRIVTLSTNEPVAFKVVISSEGLGASHQGSCVCL